MFEEAELENTATKCYNRFSGGYAGSPRHKFFGSYNQIGWTVVQWPTVIIDPEHTYQFFHIAQVTTRLKLSAISVACDKLSVRYHSLIVGQLFTL